MIRVEHLTKSFGPTRAVDDLSFEVRPGEIVGFLGPNGAGKSTTMRLLTGFLAPDNGTVTIGDIDVAQRPAEAQALIGYLPENNPLYRDLLVADLLKLAADLQRVPMNQRRAAFDFAVSSCGIGEVYYRPIGELSKGYRQRVGLAAALLHRPKIIILDEPTEGLDPNQRAEIRKLILELAKERTIIMSTHVMPEAAAICSRLLVISRGKLVADGTVAELSRNDGQSRTLALELEGDGVEAALRELPGTASVEVLERHGKRLALRLTNTGDSELQPAISKLAAQHDWTIWKLMEERRGLEEVFRELTKS